MSVLLLHPADTLLFRDGRPFNQDDEGQAQAASQFPPSPDTLMGAVRVAIAEVFGWFGGDWNKKTARFATGEATAQSKQLSELIGDRRSSAGKLKISGPFLFDTKLKSVLLPAPHHLRVQRAPAWDAIALKPGEEVLETDLGPVPLPVLSSVAGQNLRGLAGNWITSNGMKRVLDGKKLLETDLAESVDGPLWSFESRVGLARAADTRLAVHGMLYATSRVRLAPRVAIAVELHDFPDMGVDGKPLRFRNRVMLGGESRFAFVERGPDLRLERCEPNHIAEKNRVAAVLLTPALAEKMPRPGADLAPLGLPGKLVAMICERGTAYGGFEDGRPVANEPTLPAGAVLFLEKFNGKGLGNRRAFGGRTAWGYGRYLLGKW